MPAVSSGELCCATEGLDKYIPEFGNVLVQPAAGLVWKLHWLHRIGQEVHGRAARVPLVTSALSSKSEEGADAPVAAKRPILLKHLLCHCSGTSGKKLLSCSCCILAAHMLYTQELRMPRMWTKLLRMRVRGPISSYNKM